MDHSQSSMLLSSKKFEKKALEVMKQGLERTPKHVNLEKKMGSTTPAKVTLEERQEKEGGMMLYTSGTTNRPVSSISCIVVVGQLTEIRKAFSFRNPS